MDSELKGEFEELSKAKKEVIKKRIRLERKLSDVDGMINSIDKSFNEYINPRLDKIIAKSEAITNAIDERNIRKKEEHKYVFTSRSRLGAVYNFLNINVDAILKAKLHDIDFKQGENIVLVDNVMLSIELESNVITNIKKVE